MAENPIKFYLACPAEDGSNIEHHRRIAEAAESLGAVVVNRHIAEIKKIPQSKRYDLSTKQRVTGKDHFQNGIDLSLNELAEVDAFGGVLGLKSFWPGLDLGFLLGRQIPGVVFAESPAQIARLKKLSPNLNIAHISALNDNEKIIIELKKVFYPETNTENFIRTGNVAIDLEYRRALHKTTQIPLKKLEYSVLESLAIARGEFLDREAIHRYCSQKLQEETIKEAYVKNCIYTTSAKLNRFESPKRRYIDRHKKSYRLNVYPADTDVLPLIRDNGPLHADLTNEKIWLNSEDVNLSRVGSKIVCLLMEYLGTDFPKSEVMSKVWGKEVSYSRYGNELGYIRSILGDAKKDPQGFISVGYGKIKLVDKNVSS